MNLLKSLYKRAVWERIERIEATKAQERLRNKDFSIITSNCCGGWIYHMLGLRFDSPTINIWMDKKEFCMFASNLSYYLSQELQFYKKEGRTCPCARLGEPSEAVSIDFVHYKTEDEARQKWEERKQRIHWENLYIITCDGAGTSASDFELLRNVQCKRKIVFTSREHPEIEDSFILKTMKKYETAARMQLERNPVTGLRGWEKEFDYVAWLNGDRVFRK